MLRLTYLILALSLCLTGRADWKDDVGYTRLIATFTSGVPTSVAAGVSQIEAAANVSQIEAAADASGTPLNYLPSPTSFQFTGKTITNQSTGSGTSSHASSVGSYFYGNTNSLIPGTTAIDAYSAGGWQGADFLNPTTSSVPKIEIGRVQNHSWTGTYKVNEKITPEDITASVTLLNKRLDYAINRDGFVAVVGVSNGSTSSLPDLMSQGYHSIAVGINSGNHSAGLTIHDTAGRMKPDMVGPASLTSYATPMVASTAGLLSEKLRNTTYAPALTAADYPRLTKALLLAGAAKDPLSLWSRASTAKPYDAVYGAGALNAFLSYRILDAGRQAASTSTLVAETGWDINSTSRFSSPKHYYFDIPAGSVSARFSAALVWHRDLSTSSLQNGTSVTAPNFDLHLYQATGTTIGTKIDASLSAVDNVEHIYQADLPPGRYALQVTSSAFTFSSTPYALAWRTSPTVAVVATNPIADELTGAPATFTITRTGPTTSPLLVPLNWSGSAVSGSHYKAPPDSLLIPAGQSSGTVNITPFSDELAQGDRTVTLTLVTDFSLSAGADGTHIATITIKDKPFDAWRFTHFSPEQLTDDTISGDTADPDADGTSNLLEYAFDTDPLNADGITRAPTLSLDDGRLALTYLEASGRSDLTYTVETNTDLSGNWHSGIDYLEETNRVPATGADGEMVTVRRIETAERQFLRLRVSR